MSRDPRESMVSAAGVIGLAALICHTVLAAKLGPGYAIPTTLVGALAVAVVLRGPVGQAIAKRIHGGAADLPPEQVLNELDELRGRVAELEERADFSERLLARHREGQGEGQ